MLKLTKEQIDEILQRYQNGESIPALAKGFSVGETTVRRYLQVNGIELRQYFGQNKDIVTPLSKLTIEMVESLCQSYIDGVNLPELANKFNISLALVSRYLKKKGITPNRKGRGGHPPLTEKEETDIVIRYLAGESSLEIAKSYSRTAPAIMKIINKWRQQTLVNPGIIHSKKRNYKRKLNEKSQIEILKRYRKGETLASLAKEYKVSISSVVNAIKLAKELEKLSSLEVELKTTSRFTVGFTTFENVQNYHPDDKESDDK